MKQVKLKKLFKLFKKKFRSFEKSVQAKELQKAYDALQSSYSSLTSYKDLLEQRVSEEMQKQQVQEKLLAKQTRLAAMGEMIDAIAHQWSQPLTIIDMNINLMRDDFKHNLIDENYIDTTIQAIGLQTKHLQDTLKKFRDFLSPIDKNERFDLNKMIKETLLLMRDEMIRHYIEVHVTLKEETFIYGSQKEIMHVLINLINNAKDVFNTKNTQNRTINIDVKEKNSYVVLSVEDNGGGVDKDIIDDIFKPYVSTKKSDEGSGIGLYMSDLIIQKHNGKIAVKNSKKGAKFIIRFYKER